MISYAPGVEYQLVIRHDNGLEETVRVWNRQATNRGDFERAKEMKEMWRAMADRRNLPVEIIIQSRVIPEFADCENPLTGEEVTIEAKARNSSETIRWYQILTRTSDPVMLRGRMEARGLLNEDNDPKQRQEPKP